MGSPGRAHQYAAYGLVSGPMIFMAVAHFLCSEEVPYLFIPKVF